MARPKSASDEEVLQAAHRVISRRGYEGFTLAEVAREVGLTRSAIIQRFESTQALKMTLTKRVITGFRRAMEALPVSRSGDGLIRLAEFIGSMISARDSLSAFMQNFQADINDKELLVIEQERTEIFYRAVADRMPEVAIDPDSAVRAYVAHIGGSLMQWQFHEEARDAGAYLAERTRAWLKLAGLPFSEQRTKAPTPVEQLIQKAL